MGVRGESGENPGRKEREREEGKEKKKKRVLMPSRSHLLPLGGIARREEREERPFFK